MEQCFKTQPIRWLDQVRPGSAGHVIGLSFKIIELLKLSKTYESDEQMEKLIFPMFYL